ncbi:PDZ domain-containing protein [Candidatus Fermentibacteria bacterium]|nr:PDZ domain-containing protein [Candidatus Fermentibacteria bacterium]
MQRTLTVLVLCAALFPFGVSAGEGAHLGVMLGSLEDLAQKFDYDGRGAPVVEVVKDGPAAKAGMKDGDVIIAIDKDAIVGPGHLREVLSFRSPGDKAQVTVWRKGKKETLHVELGERTKLHLLDRSDFAKTIVISGEPTAWLGIRTQELSEQLGEHFGAKAGVLVSEVIEDSPAAKAGIAAGDVIVKVGEETVSQPFELTKALGDREPGQKITLVLIRQGRELTKEVELGETPKEYRRGRPQVFRWKSGDEGGSDWSFSLPRDLPPGALPGMDWLELDARVDREELQKDLQELRETLSEQMKDIRAELDELRKSLKAQD